MRRVIAFLTGGIIGIILLEIIQVIIITVVWKTLWKYYLKDHLPKTWVNNCYMMGFGHNG